MANTISVLANTVRNAVSKNRVRYIENGYNLDLAYIRDDIIAMGYPADNLEKFYRNRLEDVHKFFEEVHPDHYKIYNLCLERSYDKNKFHGRVSNYPFVDHNPPTIDLIQKFCRDVDTYLKSDPRNVVAVHCKAGKGRTGTMICCYLLYRREYNTAEDALANYDEKRTTDRKGVTIPSQRRYVQYFAQLLQSNQPYEKRTLQFSEIRFSRANTLYNQGMVHCSISVLNDTPCGSVKVETPENFCINFRETYTLNLRNLEVSGDIKIELIAKASKKKFFHFWFNTFFITSTAVIEGDGDDTRYIYTLYKNEIDDAHKDKEHKCYPADFKVQLVFSANLNHSRALVNRIRESNNSAPQNFPITNSHKHPNQASTAPIPSGLSTGEFNFCSDQRSSTSSTSASSLAGDSISGISSKISGNEHERNTSAIDRYKRSKNGNLNDINPHTLHHINNSVGDSHHNEMAVETHVDYNLISANKLLSKQKKIFDQLHQEHQHQQQQLQQQHHQHQLYQPSENNVIVVPPLKMSRGSAQGTKSRSNNQVGQINADNTNNVSTQNSTPKNGLVHCIVGDGVNRDDNCDDDCEIERDFNDDAEEDWESVNTNLPSNITTKFNENVNDSIGYDKTGKDTGMLSENDLIASNLQRNGTNNNSTNQTQSPIVCDSSNYLLVGCSKSQLHPYKKRSHNGSARLEDGCSIITASNISNVTGNNVVANKSATSHAQAAIVAKNLKPRPRRETT